MDASTKIVIAAAGLGVAAYVLYRAVPAVGKTVGGLLTGDSDLTRNQTNADGSPQTAYIGAGVLGTLGAAANTASGGWLSTFGESISQTVFDMTHPEFAATPTSSGAANQVGLDLTNGAGATIPLGQIISVGM